MYSAYHFSSPEFVHNFPAGGGGGGASHSVPRTWRRSTNSSNGQTNVVFEFYHYYFVVPLPEPNAETCRRHAFLVSFVQIFLSLLQLKNKDGDVSEFEAHPVIMGITIANLLLYCLAYATELYFDSSSSAHPTSSTFVQFVSRCKSVFGSLLMASLASIFLPPSFQPLPYVLCGLILARNLLLNCIIHGCRPSRNCAFLLPMEEEDSGMDMFGPLTISSPNRLRAFSKAC